jgi:hypothetical protein
MPSLTLSLFIALNDEWAARLIDRGARRPHRDKRPRSSGRMPVPAIASPPEITVEHFRTRVWELRQRADGPSGADVEQAINDVYAAVIALEAVRTRVSRRLQESVGKALDPGGPERLRDYAESLRALDADIGALRVVLGELRSLPVEPVRPVA